MKTKLWFDKIANELKFSSFLQSANIELLVSAKAYARKGIQ